MSNGPAKLIFVVALVVNCILLSQSRYGQIPSVSGISLFKRALVELSSGTSSDASLLQLEDQCRPISFPADKQCAHVHDVCPENESFLSIPYLHAYFCASPSIRPVAFVGLVVWLIFLFSTLGISASDFFCPNLATIAQTLGLEENVAGVTLLAFGNGSPDVFATFSAMKRDSGSLAIGELFGAASFIVSCVVGSMCIIKPFKVNRYPFLRDAGFFAVSVSLLIGVLWDGKLLVWEASSLVFLYVVYVIVVVVGTWWERKQEKKMKFETMIRDEYRTEDIPQIMVSDESAVIEPYRDDPESSHYPTTLLNAHNPVISQDRPRATSYPGPPRIQTQLSIPVPTPRSRRGSVSSSPLRSAHPAQLPSFSLLGALEFRQVVASLQSQASTSALSVFESPLTPYMRANYPHYQNYQSRQRTPSTTTEDHDPWDATLGVPLDERSSSIPDDLSQAMIIPTIAEIPPSPSETDAESQNYVPSTKRQRLYKVLVRMCHIMFPTLHHWNDKPLASKVVSLFAAPAVLALTITLPVVVTPYRGAHDSLEKSPRNDARLIDFEEEGTEIERALIAEEEVEEDMNELKFNKWLMVVQCVFGPLFCAGILFNGMEREPWLLLATGVVGITAACLVAVFGSHGENSTARLLRTCMGFFTAMVWIMAIADEVVGVLQVLGFIFGLSDAIIGLTVFAIGNSLADFVANMSVAVFAPIMGLSACFGGPMLNMLLGIGISGTYIISRSAVPYDLMYSRTLIVSGMGLLALLLLTIVFVPLNGYYLSRRWGIFLVFCYLAVMAINLVVELAM